MIPGLSVTEAEPSQGADYLLTGPVTLYEVAGVRERFVPPWRRGSRCGST